VTVPQQIARALLARGISGSVCADGRTVCVDEPRQLTAAIECLAKHFPEVTSVVHQLNEDL
jgi:putative methionine-R-sulfoxide reductase with GAF domain